MEHGVSTEIKHITLYNHKHCLRKNKFVENNISSQQPLTKTSILAFKTVNTTKNLFAIS